MIYAIRTKAHKFVKFGKTNNMDRRLEAHQVSCPLELVVLATAPWPDRTEHTIHNMLRSQAVDKMHDGQTRASGEPYYTHPVEVACILADMRMDLATMRTLVAEGGVREVNVGGIHHRAGRRQHLRYVFLNAEEEAELRELAALGAVVTAQDVPATKAVPLEELLDASEAG